MIGRETRAALLAPLLALFFVPDAAAQSVAGATQAGGGQAATRRSIGNATRPDLVGLVCDADDCDDPDDITDFLGSFGPIVFGGLHTTSDGPSHGQCGGDIYNDVWCQWTSDYTGQIVVRTCATVLWDVVLPLAYDSTKVAVYEGDSCGDNLLHCFTSGCGSHAYGLMDVEAGRRYTIRLGSSSPDDRGLGNVGIYRDCNRNGVPDWEDILFHTSADCNHNIVPDECELTGNDCNYNGVPDECDVDENENDIPDDCELEDLLCEEFDRYANLTANDTLTVFTEDHNPQQEQGFMWAYAVDSDGDAIDFDYLTGQLLVVNGLETMRYSINPVDYRSPVGHGMATDTDNDGVRDLDGEEYERTAGELLFPRFWGQDGSHASRLILVALSGGTRFNTDVDFLVYNDDEDQFSLSHNFYCWENLALTDISPLFENNWLKFFSGQNDEEDVNGTEYGWMRAFGGVANSTFFTIYDPAIYGVLVSVRVGRAAADLPFERYSQNGHLLPNTLTGDNSEDGSVSQIDESVDRLQPGSLLMYPEFDNRHGLKTVVTITNVNAVEDVRVHFIYVGRYQ